MGIFMALATIYKYVYHVGIRADPQNMKDIPLDRSVNLKIMFTKIEYKILNAVLVPHSRSITVPTAEQLYYRDQKHALGAEEDGTGGLPGGASESASLLGSSNSRAGLTSSLVNPTSATHGEEDEEEGDVVYASAVFAPVSGVLVAPASKRHVAASAMPPPPPPPQYPRASAPPAPMQDSTSSQQSASPYAPPSTAAVAAPYNPPSPTPATLSATAACPPELVCPLTQRIMSDPVMCSDGYTYERAAIEQHFRSQQELLAQMGLGEAKGTSPITKEQLESSALIPNRALVALLAKFYASQES